METAPVEQLTLWLIPYYVYSNASSYISHMNNT